MIYCVSFPKSGRTYLRYMIGKYFQLKHDLDEKHLLRYAPGAEYFGYDHGLTFTHCNFYKDDFIIPFKKLQMEKTIWLRRNPYDTLVSFYHHIKFRKKETRLTISEFVQTYEYGIMPWITFEAHADQLDNLLVLNYEDLVESPELFLHAVLRLMGEQSSSELLFRAVDESSFDEMREAEVSGRVTISEKSYIDKSDTRQLKTRVGKVNNYQNYLSPEDIRNIDEELHYYDSWKQHIDDSVRKVLKLS